MTRSKTAIFIRIQQSFGYVVANIVKKLERFMFYKNYTIHNEASGIIFSQN